ncbi:hypothetical protein COT97_04885 [Candidatus Falkowbacteria bacterium CG10_big_fil_rev_8_21_14_0_10_39_11]|uniref:Uncharacterized protein n=1 Tax=Candidatus Falkowbacteria bacterium CG10_big_fil_rev_8_21_14_0_10_39_11 TaxID=1974565 RepID=A0A2H0V611_9BACT|nr:MAG: hypothetical protein COT97_04885 [Candidatus Falkowbacteria bacterium CG10_big_fil_rev_8_21_14_0_10_39_11]
MNSFKIIFVALILLLSFGAFSQPVLAFNANSTGLSSSANSAGFNTQNTNLSVVVGKVIQALLGLFGLVLMIIIIYGGILYMLAGGDSGKVTKAKDMIIQGILGMVIIGLAYAISTYIIDLLIKTTT